MKIAIFVAMANRNIIFLTGVGRSGTTLLQSMLHAHSAINFSVETHFFKRYILPFLLTSNTIEGDRLKKDKFLKRLSPEKQQFLFSKSYSDLNDFRDGFLHIMEPDRSDKINFIGDKDTEYVRYFPHLKNVFPLAYMIHIVRDPRDVVASRLKTEWGSRRSVEFHIAEYQYYLEKVRKEGPLLFGNRFYELKYEDLLLNPESELSRLLTFLNLRFEEGMLGFYKSGSDLVAEEEKQWKGNVTKPLDKSNTGKWRGNLNESDAVVLQKGLEDFFDYMGYKRLDAKYSRMQGFKVKIIKQLFAGKTFKERLRNG